MLARLKKGEDPLELSIEKWQDIVDGKGRNFGDKNCALCEVDFIAEETNDEDYLHQCQTCIIFKKTGQEGCNETPYTNYSNAKKANENPKILKELAKEELEFLKLLRKEATA